MVAPYKHKAVGSYTCADGRAYNYFALCEPEFPLRWEASISCPTDKVTDVLKDYRCKLTGELPNVEMGDQTVKELMIYAIGRQLEETPLI
jgi:hypothetical protein